MSDLQARRRIRWRVVAAVLAGYFLSFGPAEWLVTHTNAPAFVGGFLRVIYAPCFLLAVYGPQPIRGAFVWYIELWSK